MMSLISIILPAYNESKNIFPIYEELMIQFDEINEDYEIIFVIDGCTDSTEENIRSLIRKDHKVKLISLIKNYGHQISLLAGYHHCTGDVAITMDSDMQHPPSLIPHMIQKWREGYNIVYTSRIDNHKGGIIKKWTSKYYYSFFKFFTGINIQQNAADFRLIDREVIDQIKKLPEYEIFLRGMIPWFGYFEASLDYSPSNRLSGVTKYSSYKRIKLAFNGILSFSIIPIRLVSFFGVLVSVCAFLYLIYIVFSSIKGNIEVTGYSSLIISVLFLGGVQLIAIGVLGEYIGKIFIQSKSRPRYIVKDLVGFE